MDGFYVHAGNFLTEEGVLHSPSDCTSPICDIDLDPNPDPDPDPDLQHDSDPNSDLNTFPVT